MNISDFCHAIEKPWYDRPAFKSDDFKGIALRFSQYVKDDDDIFYLNDDDDWEEVDYNSDNEITSAFFHMVGDDTDYLIEIEDIEILDDDEFCGGCGQIGCGHG
jgi:hypothetical protein